MSDAPAILVTGATAQVGLHILRDLLHAGMNVDALSRNVAVSAKVGHSSGASVAWYHPLQFKALLSNSMAQALADLSQPECLLSAGPINLAEEWLGRCESLQRIVCLSSSSVFSKADSGHPAERQQIEEILQSEKRLMAACLSRRIGLVILRPTLIYGCGQDENISRMARFIGRFGFFPLAGEAKGLRQPIHVADLAQLMVRIARTRISGQNVFEVAGGSTLSYRDMAARVFSAIGRPERLFSLPPALLARGAALASKLPGMKGVNSQMVLRQNQDLVFSDSDIRQRYDFQPRAFHPGPEDFMLPAETEQLLPAGFRVARTGSQSIKGG